MKQFEKIITLYTINTTIPFVFVFLLMIFVVAGGGESKQIVTLRLSCHKLYYFYAVYRYRAKQ